MVIKSLCLMCIRSNKNALKSNYKIEVKSICVKDNYMTINNSILLTKHKNHHDDNAKFDRFCESQSFLFLFFYFFLFLDCLTRIA